MQKNADLTVVEDATNFLMDSAESLKALEIYWREFLVQKPLDVGVSIAVIVVIYEPVFVESLAFSFEKVFVVEVRISESFKNYVFVVTPHVRRDIFIKGLDALLFCHDGIETRIKLFNQVNHIVIPFVEVYNNNINYFSKNVQYFSIILQLFSKNM